MVIRAPFSRRKCPPFSLPVYGLMTQFLAMTVPRQMGHFLATAAQSWHTRWLQGTRAWLFCLPRSQPEQGPRYMSRIVGFWLGLWCGPPC